MMWVVTAYWLICNYRPLEKHTVSIVRAEDGSDLNEIKVMGSLSAQFNVTKVAQQLFHVTLCVTSNLR
jgi:hypothetical protein